MNCFRYILFGFVALFTCTKIYSQQDFKFHHLNTSNGLPDNVVRDIFQDSKGYLWFSTTNGIVKYDGVNKIIYTHNSDDPSSLSSADVTCAAEDSMHNIWIGTSNGLNFFNPVIEKVRTFTSDDFNNIFRSQNITSIACAPDSTIWIGTSAGLFKFLSAKNKFICVLKRPCINHVSISASISYKGISFDKQGNIYAGLAGRIYCSKNKGVSFQELDLNHQTVLPNGEVWISFIKIIGDNLFYSDWGYSHVYCKNLVTGFQTEFILNKGLFCQPSEVMFDICKVNDNEYWLGGIGAVGNRTNDAFILNIFSGYVQRIKQNKQGQSAMSCGDIETVFKDKQGTVWFSGSKGVDYYNTEFALYKTCSSKEGNKYAYRGGEINAVCEDKLHNIWIGSSKGLWNFNDTSQQFVSYTIPAKHAAPMFNNISKIFLDNAGVLWLSTDTGVVEFDTKLKAFLKNKNNNTAKLIYASSDFPAVCFAQDQEKNIWMGLWESGFIKYNPITQIQEYFSSYTTNKIFYISHEWPASMAVDENDNLWVGYNDYGGFAKMNLLKHQINYYSTDALKSNLNDPIINQILPINNNKFLLATNKNGLKVFDEKNTDDKISEIKGLLSNKINGLLKDSNNCVWINTPLGLSNYNLISGIVQNFPMDATGNLNADAFCMSSSGKIFLGIDSSLISFSLPEKAEQNITSAEITTLKINGKNIVTSSSSTINLKYWQNNFSFEYSSMNFIDPELDRFFYKLEGYDKQWIDGGKQRSINYTNIPGGTYTFKVKVLNQKGVWSNIAEQKLFIETVFYKTWWFIIISVSAFVIFAYLLFTYRINQVKKIYALRTNIARDLHDQIGSTLSSISLRSEIAKMKIKKENVETKEIESIGNDARNLVELMSDIVWTINPLNDNMQELIIRMQNFANEVLVQNDIAFDFSFDENILLKKYTPDIRKNIYLIYKEAINNASKYSNATKVNAQFSLRGNELKINITDDGIGYDTLKKKKGNGLTNMASRAKEIGADLCITSAKGFGTAINFSLNS